MDSSAPTNPGPAGVPLPADSHVHSQWSWDAVAGSMVDTCRRAVELGLPSLAFTEHADLTPWRPPADFDPPERWRPLIADGVLTPPPLDVDGYHAALAECRDRFPGLRVLSGVELGEPNRHAHRARDLLERGRFERVLASVHCLPAADGAGYDDLSFPNPALSPEAVLRSYFAEVADLVERFDGFDVLAHIDYPIRSWPAGAKPYDPEDFEDEHREVLRALARAGKVLEVNTSVPLHPLVLRWWHREGGEGITFASDAHEPERLARGFRDAVALADASGFRPGRDPHDFWCRA